MSNAGTGSLDRFASSHEEIRKRIEVADGLLLCTDFDGTLAPIEADPDAPSITPANRDALRTLRDMTNTRVAVISGRALVDVRERVGIEGIVYAGNHGLELERDGSTTTHPVAAKHRGRIERICERLESDLAGIEGATVENKGVTATIHYRLTPDEEVSRVREAVESAVSRFGNGAIRRTGGKQIIELRPDVRWHKGMAVSLLAADHEGWLPMYIGDDTTDESAFRAVADGLAIHVGEGDTAAHYRVPTQPEVASCLRAFADWRTDPDAGESAITKRTDTAPETNQREL